MHYGIHAPTLRAVVVTNLARTLLKVFGGTIMLAKSRVYRRGGETGHAMTRYRHWNRSTSQSDAGNGENRAQEIRDSVE